MNASGQACDQGKTLLIKRTCSVFTGRTNKRMELIAGKDKINLNKNQKRKRVLSMESKKDRAERNEFEDMDYYHNLDKFRGKMFVNEKIGNRVKVRMQRVKNYIISGKSDEIFQLIDIESLSKALKIIKKGGIEEVTWAYKRQLRQFSIEVMRQFS